MREDELPAEPASCVHSQGSCLAQLTRLDRCHQLGQRFLCVAEQDDRLRIVQQVVIGAGKAGSHRPLEENHVVRLIDIEDRWSDSASHRSR
jgi:hypothetical protein